MIATRGRAANKLDSSDNEERSLMGAKKQKLQRFLSAHSNCYSAAGPQQQLIMSRQGSASSGASDQKVMSFLLAKGATIPPGQLNRQLRYIATAPISPRTFVDGLRLRSY
ncbi:hypothetical protein ACTJK5_10485 [Agrobacterium sp. 22094]|uniref:hypothetical protein n=1 Tax=Agrobacterium sp. 22094 TaxID=3453872 RepID=UPI003F83830C